MGVAAMLALLAAAAPLVAAGADPICAAEYAARCPRGWAYAPASGGSCARPPSYTGHCGTTEGVDGWTAAHKMAWEALCDVVPGWPTARCPAGWAYSPAREGTCAKPRNSTSHCASPFAINGWSRAKKLQWQSVCGAAWVCPGKAPAPWPQPPSPPRPVPPAPPPTPVPLPGLPGAPTITAQPARDLQPLFRPAPPWLGADCATTVPLPGGKVLWIHQDTLVGTLARQPGGYDTRKSHCMP